MTERTFRCLILVLIGLAPVVANGQVGSQRIQTQRGATLGGLAGAVAGGLIGDHNGEAGAGAAIGGVVGAVTGGLLGNAADKELRNQQHSFHHQQYSQVQSAVSLSDVISMSRSGLSDAVVINQINQRGVQQPVQVPDIISMHQQGVSESVITAMQQAQRGSPRVARVPQRSAPQMIAPAPVIVEEHYVVPHYAPPHYYHRRPSVHRHHGLHIRF